MSEFLTAFAAVAMLVAALFGWTVTILCVVSALRERRRMARTDAWVRGYNAQLAARAERSHPQRKRELAKVVKLVSRGTSGPEAA